MWSLPVAQWQRICLQCRRCSFNHWVGKIPGRRKWLPTPMEIPWTEEPGGLQSRGSQRLRHDLATKQHSFDMYFIKQVCQPLVSIGYLAS